MNSNGVRVGVRVSSSQSNGPKLCKKTWKWKTDGEDKKDGQENSVRRGGGDGSGGDKGGGKGRDKSWSSGDHFERKESQLAHQDKQRL